MKQGSAKGIIQERELLGQVIGEDNIGYLHYQT